MEQIVITHGFVKKLAANIRSKYGRDIRHTEVIELVADALGWKAGPLMHALKQADAARPARLPAVSETRAEVLPLGLAETRTNGAFDIGLVPAGERPALARFIEDQRNIGKYRDAGLDPINKMAVFGNIAPRLAGHVANSLGLPLFELSCEAIRSHGADGPACLRAAFEYAKARRGVLLLDGIETICRDRSQPEQGDAHGLASLALALLDDVPADLTVIAGTSHPGMMDRALWRRFHTRVDARPAKLDAGSVVLRPETEWLSSTQRRFVAFVERVDSGKSVLLVAEHYDLHPEVSAARAHLRRRGRNWDIIQSCRMEDLAEIYRDALRKG